MDAAFRAEPAASPPQRIEWPTEEPAKPAGRPGWVVPAIVGVAVLALAVAGFVLTR
jgi:hypothetical protein